MPTFLERNPHIIVSMAIFDMDIYAPTKRALELVMPRLTKGSLLVFDELNCRHFPGETQALHEVVPVDFNITGCPIEKDHFLAAIAALLNGDLPLYPEYPVCTECRMRENNCLLIERGLPCCGPITVAGCDARCPDLRVPCVGCRGPAAGANLDSLVAVMEEKGFSRPQLAARLRTFAPGGVA